MADAVKVNSKGKPIVEYPKLVKTEGGKVLVKNKKEEDALKADKKEPEKKAGWDNK